MTTDKAGGKAAQLRTMIIRAWRERWSDSQFATQVKVVLGRGVSGDVYSLAELLLQQALTGPAPNQLLLSLLNHCLASQLVTHSATLHSVAKFSSFSRPHCTAALLSLVQAQTPYLASRNPRPEECLQLATGLVSLSTWALTTASQSIARLVELRDSTVDLSNLSASLSLLQWLTTNTLAACLSHTGRLEDAELHQELLAAAKQATKACDQVYVFAAEGSGLEEELRAAVEAVRVLEPTNRLSSNTVCGPSVLSYTLHSLLSYDAILCPTSDLSQLSDHLATILSLHQISLATLIASMAKCCLTAMNEHDGFEVLKWDAFTLLKLPRLVAMLVGDNGRGEVHGGLQLLLQHPSLLDRTDARCRADCFELLVKAMKLLLTDQEVEQLLAGRQTQLDSRKLLDLKPPADSRDVNLITKADATLSTIIQTFENRSTEQSEFETLLSVMFHIIKGSSFDLLLSASAANGTLSALVTKLLLFNEGCIESKGESVRVSQNRAALFDMTFLMLVYTVQCFGSEVVMKDTQPCFFSTWAASCCAEPGRVKPLSGWSGDGTQFSEGLLQQFTQGEVRTQVIPWHSVCNSVHNVMREMLFARQVGAMPSEQFDRLCVQLYSKLCCLPVCVLSWQVSHAHYGSQLGTGPPQLGPAQVMDKFLEIQPDAEQEDGLPYFQQRAKMMTDIVRRMRSEVDGAGSGARPLEEEAVQLWEEVWRRGWPDIAGTKQAARLFTVGGPTWFVNTLTDRLLGQVYSEDVERACQLVFSLLHVDLVACTLALLLSTLPRALTSPSLAHPGARALARLTVHCLAASLRLSTSRPYCNGSAARTAELDTLCNGPQQPVKLRKLNGGEAVVGDLGARTSQESLVDQAHTGLFHFLSGVGMEPVLCPRLEFVSCVLEEAALTEQKLSRQLLAPAPLPLILQLVKVQPARFPMALLLRMFDCSSPGGRKQTARLVCLMRNIQAGRQEQLVTTV